jgi:hypothetical protein
LNSAPEPKKQRTPLELADLIRNSTPYTAMDLASLNKSIPPVKDWPEFDGKDEYDHISFIKYIDYLLRNYSAPDEMITSKLPRLMKGIAGDWFVTKSQAIGLQSWATWKELIIARFSTRVWKTAKRIAFESDYFDPVKHSVREWCLLQKKRIECIYTNPTAEEINDRLLTQCKGTIEHLVRFRLKDMDVDLTEFVGVLEEVVIMNGLNKKYVRSNIPEKREFSKPDIAKEKFPAAEAPTRKASIPECYNLGEKGHKRPECTNPRKKINNVETKMEEEEETDSDEYTGSQFDIVTYEPSEACIRVIQADIGDELNINTIQGDSNLPQKWDSSMKVGHVSDAKFLTNKPEKGMSYTLGKTSYTSVLFEDKSIKALLDIGAFCSCTSSNLLNEIYPEWKNNLLPVPKAKFSSCNSSMKPLGIVVMPLIFPHSKGSLRLSIEFVVLHDAICDYLILRNDTFCVYGIDIFQSKNRFYTIGGDWKSKFQICNLNIELPDVPVEMTEEMMSSKAEYLSQAAVSDILDEQQKLDVLKTCFINKESFCTTEKPIGNIKGHDMKLELTVKEPLIPPF